MAKVKESLFVFGKLLRLFSALLMWTYVMPVVQQAEVELESIHILG